VVAPVEVGFLPAPDSGADPLFLVNRFVDMVFIVDVVVSFFIAYKREERQGGQGFHNVEAMWETRLKKTSLRYLRGWFAVDVLSVLPSMFDFMSLGTSSDTKLCGGGGGTSPFKVLRMIRILRLFKLVRLLRASRLYIRFEKRNSLPYLYINFVSVISQVRPRCSPAARRMLRPRCIHAS
jgi:hypothetical protein